MKKRGGVAPASRSQFARIASVTRAAAVVVLGPRLVHLERPSAELGAVERQRLLGLIGVAELDEPEPLGLAGVAVGDDPRRVRRAELGEHRLELIVGDVVRKIPY